jgi:predicted RNase H-like HicB family nuclease
VRSGDLSVPVNTVMKYHFRVHKEDGGLWAECVELPGCVTQGDSRADLETNAQEALALYLDEPTDSILEIPLPEDVIQKKDIFSVAVSPETAFGIVLRHYRLANKISQTEMARRLGMNHVYSYQRLERKPNPTLGIIKKIKDVLPEFPLERVLS